jgi:hypothetical protein
MAAGTLNLLIEQGSTFKHKLKLRDKAGALNLAGYTARMQIRRTVSDSAVLLELTTENGRIVIDAPAGTIELVVDAADTAALNFQSAVYDLETESAGGEVRRILQGNVLLSREVTR